MKLPTLYKKNSNGSHQEWSIAVVFVPEGANIITHFGQVGGKIQMATDLVTEGKNIGKKNETTPLQQAEAEAQSQWEKKLKKGYVVDLNDAKAGKIDDIIEGGIFPMLAHKFSEQGHKIVYPAFAQPKFDGHRCIAVVKDGKATLWSRTRKPITGLPHIIQDLEVLAEDLDDPNFILDGELYNHDYRNKFEELTSFIRNPEPKDGHEVVEFHVYDQPSCRGGFGARWNSIQALMRVEDTGNGIVQVETILVQDEDDLMLAFDRFLAEGYEGAMVRNAEGLYVNKRSYDLQKVKEFDDAEFMVVGIEEGRGKLAGHAIFVCKAFNKVGTEFRVKMKGATEELKRYFDHPELAIGRWLTVKFQGYTNKNDVPRFPVGVRFKEES